MEGIMKQSTIKLIEAKFQKDVCAIDNEIRKNKIDIKRLAEKQRALKNTRKGLFEILRLIK